jgi:ribonuclease P protein component
MAPRRASSLNKLTVIDEKDLSTAQSPTLTHARIPRPDGLAGGTQDSETTTHAGARAANRFDSAQATRLGDEEAPRVRSALSFGPADRLHRRAEYLRLQKFGARYQTAHFVMYAGRLADFDHALAGTAAQSSLGMTVSRRIGSAVVRNRTRRRVRECYRLKLRSMFPQGVALIVIARSGAGALKSPAITAELLHAAGNLAAQMAQPASGWRELPRRQK